MSNVNNTLKWNTADDLGVAPSLNDVRRPGFYAARSPVGLPDGNYHVLVMKGFEIAPGNHNVKQVAYESESGAVLTRHFNGAVWGSWAGSGGGSGSAVDMSFDNRTSTGFDLVATNDIGAGDASTLPLSTTSLAGLMSATDKAKLDSLPVGFVGVYASLAALQSAIPSSTNGYYATLLNPGGDPSFAIWDDDAEDWVEAASVSVGTTNITISSNGTSVTIESDTGTDGTISTASVNTSGGTDGSGGAAGVMSAAQATKLANIKIFNVLDYGAVSYDVDDTHAGTNRTAFENAIVACAAAGGGAIYAPRGVYRISYGGAASVGGVRLRSNMALVGDGIGNTIIKAADIGNNDMAGVVRTQSGIENQNVSVRELTIDGNKGEQSGWANIICFFAGVTPDNRTVFDTDIWCVNVECKNGKNGTTGSSNLSRGYGFDPHEVVKRFAAVNCIAHDNERDGFVLDGVLDFSLVGCKSWDNGRHGFNFITTTFNGTVTGCHAWDNGDNNYVVQGDSSHITFQGNYSIGGGQNGFRIRRGGTIINTHIVMVGNTIMQAARNGIQLTGANHNVISSNLFIDNSASEHNTYFDVSLDEDDGDTMTFTGAQYNIIQNNYAVALASNKTKAAYREDENASVPPTYNTYMWNTAYGQVQSKYDDGISSTSKIIDHGFLTVYDVTGHGIVGDNATDNGAALRALVTLIEARGGGVMFFPPGTYLGSGTGTASQGVFSLPSNVHVKGAGRGTSIIKAVDPVDNSLTGIVRTRSGTDNANITVADISIDAQTCTGNGDITSFYVGGTSDAGIFLTRVGVYGGQNGTGVTGYGVRVTSTAQRVYMDELHVMNNERDNVYVDGAQIVNLMRSFISSAGRHNVNISNGATYVDVKSNALTEPTTNNVFISEQAARIRITDNLITSSGEDNIRVRRGSVDDSTKVDIDGNTIMFAGRDGISFAGCADNRVSNNRFDGNGSAASDTYSDVSFELDSTYNSTKANSNFCHGNFHADPSSLDYVYAERTNAGTDNLVLNNYILGSGISGSYLLAASSTTKFIDHTTSIAAGSDNEFQYNNGGSLGGTAGLTYDETNSRPRAINGVVAGPPGTPAAPAATDVVYQSAQRAATALPAVYKNIEKTLQHGLAERAWGQFIPNSNSTTLVVPGFANSTIGTVTAAAWASTNRLTSQRRISYVSPGTAGNGAGVRQSSRFLWRGNAAGLGGFSAHIVFGIPTTLTAPRLFVGMYGASTFAVDDGDPSGLTNIFGVGASVSDTNLRFYTNDGTGSPVITDLGANFPLTGGVMYELFVFAPINGSTMEYYVRRLDTNFVATGTVAADLPASGTALGAQAAIHNGATAEAATIDIMSMYYETAKF